MGQKHNTHIANATDMDVRVVLTDNDKRNTSQIVKSKEYVCIPTPHGRVSVTVFRKMQGKNAEGATQYSPKGEANYTDNSDRSFIIKEVDGSLTIVRTKYGHIWKEETGLR